MLLDLNRFRGEREDIERTLEPSAFEPQDEHYRVAAPVEVSMDVRKAGQEKFDVTGRLRTELELGCSRCLDLVRLPVDTSFELRYLPQTQNAGEGEREIGEDDLTTAYYRDGVLDVTELLREQFELSVPMKPLCKEDCLGLCLHCGANRNRVDCGHSSRWEDPRLAPLKGLMNRPMEN